MLLLNVQHSGEETIFTAIRDPTKFQSHWPGGAGYGSGSVTARPRVATMMVIKDGGGGVGS